MGTEGWAPWGRAGPAGEGSGSLGGSPAGVGAAPPEVRGGVCLLPPHPHFGAEPEEIRSGLYLPGPGSPNCTFPQELLPWTLWPGGYSSVDESESGGGRPLPTGARAAAAGPGGAGRAARLLRLNFGPAALPPALAASGAHRFNVGLAPELFCEAPSLE